MNFDGLPPPAGPTPVVPGRTLWTGRRFAAANIVPPVFVFVGAWLVTGQDDLVVGPRWGIAYLIIAAAFVLTYLLSVRFAFRRWLTGIVWIASGLMLGVATLEALFLSMTSFSVAARTTAEDGKTYLLLDSSFTQGMTVRMARVRKETLGLAWIEVLAESGYDSPRSVAWLVRPDHPSPVEGRQIHVSGDGFVAGFLHSTDCVVAFDSRTGKSFGRGSGPDIEELSPFRLVEQGGSPLDADVAAFASEGAELAHGPPGPRQDRRFALKEAPLAAALESRNESVRAAASRIIRAGGRVLYPSAFDRVR